MPQRLVDLQKRLKSKTPKGYNVLSQGYPTKRDASTSAKKMRGIGYRARVIKDDKWYRLAVK